MRRSTPGFGKGVALIEIDPDRAPLVRWAFEMYATGEWTLQGLTDALDDKGLRWLATAARPSRPLAKSTVAQMLVNPYYTGVVRFQGVTYEGRHDPLIDTVLFLLVQDVLKANAVAGEKTRVHQHYLKGTVYCGECRSKMVFSRNRGRHGKYYDYFKCMGRQLGLNCPIAYVRADFIEEQVELAWTDISLTAEETIVLRRQLVERLRESRSLVDKELVRQRQRRETLDNERLALLRAHLAGAVPLDLLKSEQERITREMAQVDSVLLVAGVDSATVETTISQALLLAEHGASCYLGASPALLRRMNQAVFERVEVHRNGHTPTVTSTLRNFGPDPKPSPDDDDGGSDDSVRLSALVGGWNIRNLVPPTTLDWNRVHAWLQDVEVLRQVVAARGPWA